MSEMSPSIERSLVMVPLVNAPVDKLSSIESPIVQLLPMAAYVVGRHNSSLECSEPSAKFERGLGIVGEDRSKLTVDNIMIPLEKMK